MDWLQQVDGYCERLDFSFWAEPLNAVTNLAFIIAALLMWARYPVPGARILSVILGVIGVGSFLFHTFATLWASTADVVPIGVFILTYLYLVNRDALGLPVWLALVGVALFVPYAAVLVPVLNAVPFVQISNFYWTVPILLVVYALYLRGPVGRGFVIGAAILCVSIVVRSLDEILCPVWPIGTHFAWHCLNGVMLGYMIHVYATHILAGGRRGR